MYYIRLTHENQLSCEGDWTLKNIKAIIAELSSLKLPAQKDITIIGSELALLDSAGAWQIFQLQQRLIDANQTVQLVNFNDTVRKLIDITIAKSSEFKKEFTKPDHKNILSLLGAVVIQKYRQSVKLISFVGESTILLKSFLRLQYWQFPSILRTIQECGCYALPIIGLLSFLIGIVLAYQLGIQLRQYGGNIYIVNIVGMAILREFGPLITAIIVAGRTSSAITAEIGLMKVNEEIDALFAMGLSPVARIAIPRIIGVIIVLPLLTVWADAFGVFGSMVMSNNMLSISMSDFLSRFDDVIEQSDFWTGITKAPVFGLLVATVGCFQGFQVSYSSESIGQQTTKSVVQAIFLVIIADAVFSILFSKVGL